MNKKTGLILILFTALVSGFSIFINKFGIKGINPYVFTFSKNIIVALVLFSTILFFREFAAIKQLTKNQWFKLASKRCVSGCE